MPSIRTAPHRLRELREAQGKTSQQVAADAAISPAAYRRAERGGPVWRLTVEKIARALHVDPEELLEADEGKPEEPGHQKARGQNPWRT